MSNEVRNQITIVDNGNGDEPQVSYTDNRPFASVLELIGEIWLVLLTWERVQASGVEVAEAEKWIHRRLEPCIAGRSVSDRQLTTAPQTALRFLSLVVTEGGDHVVVGLHECRPGRLGVGRAG